MESTTARRFDRQRSGESAKRGARKNWQCSWADRKRGGRKGQIIGEQRICGMDKTRISAIHQCKWEIWKAGFGGNFARNRHKNIWRGQQIGCILGNEIFFKLRWQNIQKFFGSESTNWRTVKNTRHKLSGANHAFTNGMRSRRHWRPKSINTRHHSINYVI